MDYKKRKEVIDNMIKLSEGLKEELSENKQEIVDIEYYRDFRIKGTNLGIDGAYVVKIKDDTVPEKETKTRNKDEKEVGYSYQIYDKDNNLVATVNKEGDITFNPEYLETIRKGYLDDLNLEDAEFELPKELEKDDLVLEKDEIEEIENEKKLEDISKTIGTDEINSYSEMSTNQRPVFDKITNKQELDPNIRVTQTETLADMIPELKQKGIVKVGVVYSDYSKGQNGRFSFIGIDKNGKIQSIDSLENTQGTTTGQKVTSINSRDGSLVEQEQVAGMVRINGRNTGSGREELLSVRQGQYGILEVDYVRAELSENKEKRYVSAPIETRNIRPTTREVRDFMDKTKNPDMTEEIKRATPELERDNETKMQNIDDTASNDRVEADDIIVLENGEETTLRKEATKAKVSVEDFVRRYNERTGNTPDEKINDIQDEYAEEYGEPTRKR